MAKRQGCGKGQNSQDTVQSAEFGVKYKLRGAGNKKRTILTCPDIVGKPKLEARQIAVDFAASHLPGVHPGKRISGISVDI